LDAGDFLSSLTVTTDTENGGAGDGTTPTDPVETNVTWPAALPSPSAGTIKIAESAPVGVALSGFSFAGLQVTIAAPQATAAAPLKIVFRLDGSKIPAGTPTSDIVVTKDGLVVRACTATPPAQISPDPCETV